MSEIACLLTQSFVSDPVVTHAGKVFRIFRSVSSILLFVVTLLLLTGRNRQENERIAAQRSCHSLIDKWKG
jgi:hypothetical protein